MRRLEIKNIGPIEALSIDLNRYNVFIGKQSSGKSTIAKIISNCTWMEKEVLINPSNPTSYYEGTYVNELKNFHNMDGYLYNDSYLKYESDFVSIILEGNNCSITRKKGDKVYQKKKTLYIPAERNMVVYTDSIGGANNLRSFAADWQSARDIFDKNHQQKILDLGIYYYKTGENGKTINHVTASSKNHPYDINLKNGSSGLQSVIPITTTLDFYTGAFYTPGNQEILMKANDKYSVRQLVQYYVKTRNITDAEKEKDDIVKIVTEVMGLVNTASTSFIIEEPENNLFPETQYSLINFIIECTKRNMRHHEVTITTHSPYVLSSLNIMLLAGLLIRQNVPEAKKLIGNVFIDNSEFSAWTVSDGGVISIIDKDTHLISENYLDSVSDILAGKFNQLYRLYLKSIKKE